MLTVISVLVIAMVTTAIFFRLSTTVFSDYAKQVVRHGEKLLSLVCQDTNFEWFKEIDIDSIRPNSCEIDILEQLIDKMPLESKERIQSIALPFEKLRFGFGVPPYSFKRISARNLEREWRKVILERRQEKPSHTEVDLTEGSLDGSSSGVVYRGGVGPNQHTHPWKKGGPPVFPE